MFTRSRFFKQNVWFAGLSLVLGAALALAGCDNSTSSSNKLEGVPVGTWTAGYGDQFVITANTLAYYDSSTAAAPVYEGTIQYIEYFNNTTGVMIIEYTADGKPEYYEYGGPPNYEQISGPFPPLGNFRAVYLTNITTASIEISAAADAGDPCYRSEKETLAAAKAAFTLDNIDTYVTYPSAYLKQ